MSMWDEVFGSLQAMTLWQLLFAFVACTGYALAQGRLVEVRAKYAAGGLTVVAALAFVIEAERWVDGFMLMAVAIAGMGVFAAMVWLLSRMLGLTTSMPASPVDSLVTLPPPGSEDSIATGTPLASSPRAAPSH